jgi:hypothetical protein
MWAFAILPGIMMQRGYSLRRCRPYSVAPINDLLSELEDFEDDDDFRELEISADYLHMDNIS